MDHQKRLSQLENDRKILLDFIYHQFPHAIPQNFQTAQQSSIDVNELIRSLKLVLSPKQLSPTNSTTTVASISDSPPSSLNNHNASASTVQGAAHQNLMSPTTQKIQQQNQQYQQPLPATPQQMQQNQLISSPPPNFTDMHSQHSPRNQVQPQQQAARTETSPQLNITVPEDYGNLNKEQFHFASYETYVLVNHFSRPSDTPANREQEDNFRIQMEISKVKHESYLLMLSPPSNASTPVPHFNSVTYRLWLLRYFDMRRFDSFDSMIIWFRRQLYTVMSAIQNMLRDPFDEKSPPSTMLTTFRQLCFALESYILTTKPNSTTDTSYQHHLGELDKFLAQIVTRGASPTTRSQVLRATEFLNEPVPYQFPLNTTIFEDLLFYNLFEFSSEEIVFVGSPRMTLVSDLLPLARALKISETMATISHANCFLTAYQAELSGNHLERLQRALDMIENMISTNVAAIHDRQYATAALLKLTLKRIAQWLLKMLSDVHTHKSEHVSHDIEIACSVYIQSRQMWSMLATNNSNGSKAKPSEANFASFIVSSVSCHYSRISKPFRPLTLDNFTEFIEALMPEITLDLRIYTKGFARYHSSASLIALSEFANLYTQDLGVVFDDVYFLSPMVLQSVQTSSQFQIFLNDLNILPPEKLPPVTKYVSSVVSAWCQNQEKFFNKWFENLFQVDKFQPLDKTIKHSSSVVDLFQMFYQAINTLSKMKGSLSSSFPGFIVTLSNMFNKFLIMYNQTIAEFTLCNQRQSLIPLSLNEKIKKGIRKSLSHSINTLQVSAAGSNKEQAPPTMLERTQKQAIQTLCVCLNNLDFIQKNIVEYIEHHSYNLNDLKKQLSDLFIPVQSAIRTNSNNLIDYIGAKVVFADCRTSIIEELYQAPLTRQPRIDDPLDLLNPHLKAIYANTHSIERANDILTAVAKAFLQAYEYVVLYGGPTRIFNTGETQWIEADLETIKDFFLDRDEQGNSNGVNEKIYDQMAGGMTKICHLLMDQSSDILIDQYVNGKANAFSNEILLALLVHRSDKPARSFIKKKLHDPHYLHIKKGSKVNFLTK